jgi:hypothetical protein
MTQDLENLLAVRRQQREAAAKADEVIAREVRAIDALSGRGIAPLNSWDAITVSAEWLAFVITRRQED